MELTQHEIQQEHHALRQNRRPPWLGRHHARHHPRDVIDPHGGKEHAVELRLFKEILNSAHTKIMKKALTNFLKGYKTTVGSERFNRVTNLVMVIESRGRYANVV